MDMEKLTERARGFVQAAQTIALREQDRVGKDELPDQRLDLEEQERFGRSRYAYPEGDRNIAPPTYTDRPTPSGRSS